MIKYSKCSNLTEFIFWFCSHSNDNMDSDMVKIVDGFPEELRKCHKNETKDINKDGAMINHYLQVRDLM